MGNIGGKEKEDEHADEGRFQNVYKHIEAGDRMLDPVMPPKGKDHQPIDPDNKAAVDHELRYRKGQPKKSRLKPKPIGKKEGQIDSKEINYQ